MHGEQPVEDLWSDEVIVRNRQLNPHQQRLRSGEDQEDERIDDVHDADFLVVYGRKPLVYYAGSGGVARGCGLVYGFQDWGFFGHAAPLSDRWLVERREICRNCIQVVTAQMHGR